MTQRSALIACLLTLGLGLVAPVPAWAQGQGEQQADAAEAQGKAAESSQPSARDERIADYLRKKEERRIERERARELESQQLAEQALLAEAGAKAAQTPAGRTVSTPPEGLPRLPKDLAAAQAAIRLSSLAEDPTVARYLDMIDRSQASAQQLAAFGNFIADHGFDRLGLTYYLVAMRLENDDPVMWNNLGTLYRQLSEWDNAKRAFSKALSINPADAMAHYNLGAVYDQQRKYNQAVREFRIALSLDPTLGDPQYNPSAANNERLLAVKLLIYQEQAGNVGLPLVDVAGGDIGNLSLSNADVRQQRP